MKVHARGILIFSVNYVHYKQSVHDYFCSFFEICVHMCIYINKCVYMYILCYLKEWRHYLSQLILKFIFVAILNL